MPPAYTISESFRVARLSPPQWGDPPVDMVLDTDTFNEIDDQFALTYAMLSPDRIRLQAVYAAPFHNDRSSGPGDGMEKSHAEILELFQRMGRSPTGLVHRGARAWMRDAGPVESEAVADLIAKAKRRSRDDAPLYVVAIGAITNVASALVLAPEIMDRIVVVWLGGHPPSWHTAQEFNLSGDLTASQVLYDCGVPLVQVPCCNVAQKLRTTVSEMRQYVAGRGPIGDFLFARYAAYEAYETPKKMRWNAGRPIAYTKEIWDVAPVAWLVDPRWAPSGLVSSPILTQGQTYSRDDRRHLVRVVDDMHRDEIFGDLFAKLATASGGTGVSPASTVTG